MLAAVAGDVFNVLPGAFALVGTWKVALDVAVIILLFLWYFTDALHVGARQIQPSSMIG